jgi:hypothetical protein
MGNSPLKYYLSYDEYNFVKPTVLHIVLNSAVIYAEQQHNNEFWRKTFL